MMDLTYRCLNNCGIHEIQGVNDHTLWRPTDFFRAFAEFDRNSLAKKVVNFGQGVYILSYARDKTNNPSQLVEYPRHRSEAGLENFRRLGRYIVKNGLGTWTEAPADAPHPGYAGEHLLTVVIWVPNNPAIRKYMIEKEYLKAEKKAKITKANVAFGAAHRWIVT